MPSDTATLMWSDLTGTNPADVEFFFRDATASSGPGPLRCQGHTITLS